ncbi:MAG: hypothetical protein WDN46_03885 [Methylocella sp.]
MATENRDLRSQLVREFGKLKIRANKEPDLAREIDDLVLFASHMRMVEDKSRRAFRPCETTLAVKELASISTRAGSLAHALESPSRHARRSCLQLAVRLETMHQTTIDALADTPAFKTDRDDYVLLDVGYVRTQFPNELRAVEIDRRRLAEDLRPLARAASMATPKESQDAGRARDNFAHGVGRHLAYSYQRLTEREPTIVVDPPEKALKAIPYAGLPTRKALDRAGYPRGVFLDLITNVFLAMHIDTDPLHVARSAIAHLKKVQPLSS